MRNRLPNEHTDDYHDRHRVIYQSDLSSNPMISFFLIIYFLLIIFNKLIIKFVIDNNKYVFSFCNLKKKEEEEKFK